MFDQKLLSMIYFMPYHATLKNVIYLNVMIYYIKDKGKNLLYFLHQKKINESAPDTKHLTANKNNDNELKYSYTKMA